MGVIDVQQLFGMGAVQFDTEIDLVIQLEQWVDGKFYDRLGLGEEKYEMLGVELPIVTIPVRPGRNLAGIVEIATMKNRQMKYGYNAARGWPFSSASPAFRLVPPISTPTYFIALPAAPSPDRSDSLPVCEIPSCPILLLFTPSHQIHPQHHRAVYGSQDAADIPSHTFRT